MVRKRSDKALGHDPLDALDDIEWIIRDEAEANSKAEFLHEQALAESEAPADVEAAEIEPAPGRPKAQPETEAVKPAADAEVEPAAGAEESQAAQPTEGPSPAPPAEEGDAEEDGGDDEAVAEPDDEVSHVLDELIAAIDRDVEQTLRPEAMFDPADTAPARPEGEEQHVIFTLAGAEYAVPITNVIEIGRLLNVTPVPNVPDWVLGVANLRGDIISMVDLRAFLGMERTGYGHASRMLVVQAQQGKLTTGLIVDRVSGIWYVPMDQIGAPAAPIEDQVTPYLRGVYEHRGRLLVVLDLNRLLLSPEMRQFEPI